MDPQLIDVLIRVVLERLVLALWGSQLGDGESGGAAFAQTCRSPRAVITTSLKQPPEEAPAGTLAHAAAQRPFGLVSDRLSDIRYPDEYATYTRTDWDRWLRDVGAQAEAWVVDDARWTATHVTVDNVLIDGVKTQVDARYVAGSFPLPEGRLDIGIERVRRTGAGMDFEELSITRSSGLHDVSI